MRCSRVDGHVVHFAVGISSASSFRITSITATPFSTTAEKPGRIAVNLQVGSTVGPLGWGQLALSECLQQSLLMRFQSKQLWVQFVESSFEGVLTMPDSACLQERAGHAT